MAIKVDESDWHELKDKLYVLKKRVEEHSEERGDMVTLLQFLCNPENNVNKLRVVTKKFLREIGELD